MPFGLQDEPSIWTTFELAKLSPRGSPSGSATLSAGAVQARGRGTLRATARWPQLKNLSVLSVSWSIAS